MPRQTRKSTSRRRSHGATRRAKRPSVMESIQQANKRAHKRANQRIGKRRGQTSIRAAISPTHDEHDYTLPTSQVIWRSLLALLLLIPSAISTIALFTITEHAGNSHFWSNLIHSRPFLFFAVGCFLMLGWFYSRLLGNFFLYLYVLGHELTHAFFILACGGKVSGMNITVDGGYVMTNKSNILIALSPYFIPFWSIIILAISATIKAFWDIPYHDYALYLALGYSWTFHLAWTVWMIPRDQPDLKENGTFFSLVIIYIANVLLLAGMLCLTPDGLTFKSYFSHWISLFVEFSELAARAYLTVF